MDGNSVQPTQFWIAFGFAATFVVFLMLAFFASKHLTAGQHLILRILTSVCLGLSGILFTGLISIQAGGTVEGIKWSLSAVGGTALAVFFFIKFPTFIEPRQGPVQPPKPPKEGAVSLSIVKGKKFRDVVDALVFAEQKKVKFEGFTDEEKNAVLKPYKLQADTTGDALTNLNLITEKEGAIRDYSVTFADSIYVLKIKS